MTSRILFRVFLVIAIYAAVVFAVAGKPGGRVDAVGAGDRQLFVKHCVYYKPWPPFEYEIGLPQALAINAAAIRCPKMAWSVL